MCGRSRFQRHGQLIISHNYCGVLLLIRAFDSWLKCTQMQDILQDEYYRDVSMEWACRCGRNLGTLIYAWWRNQMETFSALLALCAGNSPVTGEFPAQRPVTRGSDVFFDLRLNKQLIKQSWGWWFETPSRSLWLHNNGIWVPRMDASANWSH